MGTEVELSAGSPILVHVSKADCALLHWLHRLPLFCVLTQSVRRWWGVCCCRISWRCWWWIASKDGTVEREVVGKEIVQERIVSSSPKHLARRHLLRLLTQKAKLLGSRIWNGLLNERHMLLRLLLDLVAWLSWSPRLEVCRIKADMVLPYVLTQPLKNRVGPKLCRKMLDQHI